MTKQAKVQFSQACAERHNAELDDIRRGWKQKMADFDRAKVAVDIRYESLQTRLETIATALDKKTAQEKEKIASLKASVEKLTRNIRRAKASEELRGIDESAEMQIELKLQMQTKQLRDQLNKMKAETADVTSRGDKYKGLYLKAIARQKKINYKRETKVRLAEAESQRKLDFDAFREMIKQEQKRLNDDVETLRRMREELMHPPPAPPSPKKKSPKEMYLEMLKEAGQHVDDDDRVAVSGFQDTTHEPITFEDDEEVEEVPHRESVHDVDYEQISYLENTIRTLLATGNYSESDPLIVGLRAQITDAMNCDC